jgi:DNA-binding GntR family transcriptional regulator
MNSMPTNGELGDILHKRSLTDEVYVYLYRRIIAGNYSPGDWLRQEEISTQLGVSQTPVREALDRLATSGLAERVPFRGVRVQILDAKEILDAFTIRLVLETLAARLIANSIKPEEIADLGAIVQETASLLSLEDMSTLRQLNKEFHKRIVDIAGNSLLSKLYELATNSFPDWMLYEYLFRHPDLLQSELEREYQEHQAIVESLSSHDPDLASAQIATHIKNLGTELETYLNISADAINQIESQIEPMITHSKTD